MIWQTNNFNTRHGVGEIITANTLRKKLSANHKIILIEKNSVHSFAPSFLWLMIGERTAEQIITPLKKLVLPDIQKSFLTVIGSKKNKDTLVPYRNAWIYVDTSTFKSKSLSKFGMTGNFFERKVKLKVID